MKKILVCLSLVLLTINLFSQTPQKMSYQAIIRNSSGELVKNLQVGVQISILQGSASGNVVYSEIQTPATNANGLIGIEIGGGPGFDAINWSAGPYFIKTETDPAGGNNYTVVGTSQLLSVPYALHAKTADNLAAGVNETDPVFGASAAMGISNIAINNWNTSYGWGDHATVGYLKSFTETDPLFSASAAKNISSTNVTDWNSAFGWGNHATAGYLKSFIETDPVFTVSAAKNISSTNVTDWNTAFGWGNHATAGYLKSFIETDPLFSASVAKNISSTNVNDWNTAFGWGNHATAGYLKSYTETDPKIGANTAGYLPKWDGAALVTGAIYQDASGNIGLGTITPSAKLQINGNATIDNLSARSILTLASTSGATPFLTFGGTSGGLIQTAQNTLSMRFGSGGSASSVDFESAKITFRTSGFTGYERLTINASGDVGIGTTTPAYKLDVQGTINALAGICIGGNCISSWASLTPWLSNGANIYFNTGNVGIGTTTPATKLEVNGIISASGGNSSNWNTAYGWGNHATAGYQSAITAGTVAQYWRGDKTWQTLDKSAVGLGAVENTALTTWTGSSNLTTLGTVTAGVWNAGAITSSGVVTATSIVKTGGTASQFLKADGSVDGNTYLTTVREAADEFTATASQTSFALSQVPMAGSKVKMYINGVRISNTAYNNSGSSLTYVPANNGSYVLTAGDRVQFDYSY